MRNEVLNIRMDEEEGSGRLGVEIEVEEDVEDAEVE